MNVRNRFRQFNRSCFVPFYVLMALGCTSENSGSSESDVPAVSGDQMSAVDGSAGAGAGSEGAMDPGGEPNAGGGNSGADTGSGASTDAGGGAADAGSSSEPTVTAGAVCNGVNDFSNIPAAYAAPLMKYTATNIEFLVYVCTEDADGDGAADFMVIESINIPEHKSVYVPDTSSSYYEDFDFVTNIYKFGDVYTDQTPGAAGPNKISPQSVTMRMPIAPAEAASKTETPFSTIGLSLNGISFFNENASPPDEITDELFTFDQCSGHPDGSGVYHYHVDPVCLIRDLGGNVTDGSRTVDGTTYAWIEDGGSNAGMLLGFLMDGFPVYGPVGTGETDCNGGTVSTAIDQYNGHSHCTADFADPIYHYHVKSANVGGTGTPVFWVTNQFFYGNVGSVVNSAASTSMDGAPPSR